jgi:hypothetical protein
MGLHQDRDERDLGAPVVSLSLGDTCLFRIGGTKRSDPTRSLRLASGDAVVLAGEARLPRRRSHHAGDVDPVAGRRAHQSHAAAGDRPRGRAAGAGTGARKRLAARNWRLTASRLCEQRTWRRPYPPQRNHGNIIA